jgi:hypothetical protein
MGGCTAACAQPITLAISNLFARRGFPNEEPHLHSAGADSRCAGAAGKSIFFDSFAPRPPCPRMSGAQKKFLQAEPKPA